MFSCLKEGIKKGKEVRKQRQNVAETYFTSDSEGQTVPAVCDVEVLPVTSDPGSPEATAHVHGDIWLYSNEPETSAYVLHLSHRPDSDGIVAHRFSCLAPPPAGETSALSL